MLKKGNAIISTPSLIDDLYFHRSVILITESDKNNSMGFIINKKLEYTLNEVTNKLKYFFPLYYGGPVEPDSLFFVYKSKVNISESKTISENLKWNGDFEEILKKINQNKITKGDIKFFLGYSGWTKSQLEQEINSKSWELIKILNEKYVFTDKTESIWKKSIQSFGEKYLIWSNTPDNPNHN